MNSLVKGIIILPGTVALFVPLALLYISYLYLDVPLMISTNILVLLTALCLLVVGLFLAATTTRLFLQLGNGTPAPWDPPKSLVIKGPYRYVRNPMIIGMLCILTSEALLFWSLPLAYWTLIFFIANLVYFPLVEEKKLRMRFGTQYEEYTHHVPRWIPRFSPWKK
jgi:protein-S-isoprenylcysteine O-methyltransferase Ste14